MKFPLHLLIGGALAVLAPEPFAGRAADTPKLTYADLFENPVIVKGRGIEIRQQELDDNFRALKSTLATQGQTIAPPQERQARQRLLDRMILARTLDQRATADDRARAKVSAEKFIADTKARALSEASYARQLMAVGMTVEAFEKRALEQALVEEVINREIRSSLSVSSAEIQRFYDTGGDIRTEELDKRIAAMESAGDTTSARYEQTRMQLEAIKRANLARLDRPERVRADLLLLYTVDRVTRDPLPDAVQAKKLELAKQLRTRLVGGADFTEIVLEYSEDPDAPTTKGEYVAARSAPMAPELKEALFSLPVGQISDVVSAKLGYYLIRVREHRPAEKVPFAEAEEDVRELLLTQKVERQLPDYFTKLKQDYDVELLDTEAVE
jgi:parvulin-like peptidyl-prolyl isomerase